MDTDWHSTWLKYCTSEIFGILCCEVKVVVCELFSIEASLGCLILIQTVISKCWSDVDRGELEVQ